MMLQGDLLVTWRISDKVHPTAYLCGAVIKPLSQTFPENI